MELLPAGTEERAQAAANFVVGLPMQWWSTAWPGVEGLLVPEPTGDDAERSLYRTHSGIELQVFRSTEDVEALDLSLACWWVEDWEWEREYADLTRAFKGALRGSTVLGMPAEIIEEPADDHRVLAEQLPGDGIPSWIARWDTPSARVWLVGNSNQGDECLPWAVSMFVTIPEG